MFSKAVLCLSTLYFHSVAAQGECTDLRGRLIANGLHYVPGPDTCTLCVCDNGVPKVCKAVLCSPPQDCRSFRVGTTCCEFICLDDVVKPAEGTEANVRVAAGGAAAVVLLTVAFVVYRVRKQKRRRPPHTEDQRSLTSIGYISGSMGYMGGGCEATVLGAWKPPSNYLPRGEAPPPYEEAMAQCRQEPVRVSNEASFHRTYAAAVEARDDVCASHAYVNLPRPLTQIANTQNCYNAPLLQPVHPAEVREAGVLAHPLAPNMGAVGPAGGGARLTGSLGAISARLSVPRDDHERPHNVPGFYATHTALHRTIPRISTAVDTSTLEAMGLGFTRADRSLQGEVRRSFHRPVERADRIDRASTGRSVPRNLNIASTASVAPADAHRPDAHADDAISLRSMSGRARVHSDEQDVKPKPQPDHPTLPLTVDKPSCVCSYEGSARAEDADDYRNECENCHSTNNPSGWEESADGTEWGGTQTLQRRAPPPPAPPPATATLPQPVTRHGRNTMDNPSNWENWFNTIPDSDTESEEE
ncbi:uncharacterized protein LOC112052187 isoform X2 [Bicyclus anynana]|uniref:Uncharacterized protein LOC112052187 isoform X2 n=1 Tax=Bicyclus anynana TaxID=110368 RepID=A0A6J1NPD9_BICAN|nr:uncharacterized protein LOC112052187 isoform X2 [Bicyclus anynana]